MCGSHKKPKNKQFNKNTQGAKRPSVPGVLGAEERSDVAPNEETKCKKELWGGGV